MQIAAKYCVHGNGYNKASLDTRVSIASCSDVILFNATIEMPLNPICSYALIPKPLRCALIVSYISLRFPGIPFSRFYTYILWYIPPPGSPRLPQATPGYLRLPQATPGYLRLPQVTPGYPRLPQATPGYPFWCDEANCNLEMVHVIKPCHYSASATEILLPAPHFWTFSAARNAIFWYVTPCDSCRNWLFGGTHRFHDKGEHNQLYRTKLSVIIKFLRSVL
jgi:hypothetical protein